MKKWWKDNWDIFLAVSFAVGSIIFIIILILKQDAVDRARIDKQEWLNCREVERQEAAGSQWAADAFKAWDCQEILDKVKVD